jgi:pimeloyl-ACP methyl ester carboxylesterase
MQDTEKGESFEGTWPYAPKGFDTPDGRMHYIDVGPEEGRPVVLLHGNPTWGYLYRNFIPELLAAGHRVIVVDHLGFGLSSKPDSPEAYGIERHARRLESLLEFLDLHNATLGVHDWGGPIGLYWAVRHPARVSSLAIFNSFVHKPTGPVALPLPLRIFRMRALGELFVKVLHGIVRVFLFRAGVAKPERLTSVVRRAYLAPHPSLSDRTAILAFARQFPTSPEGPVAELHGSIQSGLSRLASKPVFVAWAAKDAIATEAMLLLWLKDFPHAEVLRLPEAGHFLQEDAHEAVVPALVTFLKRAERLAA